MSGWLAFIIFHCGEWWWCKEEEKQKYLLFEHVPILKIKFYYYKRNNNDFRVNIGKFWCFSGKLLQVEWIILVMKSENFLIVE